MEEKTVKVILSIQGMTCSSCALKIESTLKQLNGIITVKVSLANANAEISYNEQIIDIAEIIKKIDALGYQAESLIGNKNNQKLKSDGFKIDQLIGIGIIIAALYIIIKHTIGFNFIPEIDQSMGYGVLFLVGALTSLHCVAMCGGINMSQCMTSTNVEEGQFTKLKPSMMYNAGRVISYTIIGGVVGAIGSVISFSGMAKGIVAVLAGVFMIIMGLNMLNIFPWLRRFNIRMPKFVGQKLYSGKSNKGPFVVGLLNGLMPCGPLQSMQLYALGTGSFMAGAASMFFFSIGTVPLMFGLGAIVSMLSKKFTSNLMKFSAILVVILGVGMISRGMSLSGFNTVMASTVKGNVAVVEGNVQTVEIELSSNIYEPIVVQKGIPVKFIINAEQENINGCNNAIIIPKYNIEKGLIAGENIIEFTPDEEGTIPYSCWMGMIRSSIRVVENVNQLKDIEVEELSNTPSTVGSSGSCCDPGVAVNTIADTKSEDIFVAEANKDIQEISITVDERGFTPNIIVLERGTKAKFKFQLKSLNQCNSAVVFPEYQGGIDFNKGETETPELEISESFGFSCWMGMINGYVKVVDSVEGIDLEVVKEDAKRYAPPASSAAGCH